MNNQGVDLNYLCRVIGNLSGVPIRIYEGDRLCFYYSIANLPRDPVCLCISDLLEIDGHVGYYVTPEFNYYGLVRDGDRRIIIGPTGFSGMREQQLRELAFRIDLPPADTNDFVTAMKSIIDMPLDSVMQILFTINHVITGERLALEDVSIIDSQQQTIRSELEREQATRRLADADEPEPFTNNTYNLEQIIIGMVRKGDTGALRAWLAEAPAVRPGTLASEQLRQLKNTFIVTATLVCRAAIQGGMDVQDALSLSDSYIRKCELMTDTQFIVNLQYHMVLDYTERVERLRRGCDPSKLVVEVKNYILHHLSEPIKTEEIARSMFISRSRLSTRFKEETGENLCDFILSEKVAEGKRLLRYSDKSVVAISAYLGFSSQSHFTRVFKKYTGSSPKEYRERHK